MPKRIRHLDNLFQTDMAAVLDLMECPDITKISSQAACSNDVASQSSKARYTLPIVCRQIKVARVDPSISSILD
jgi:hypothetical protein